MTLEDLVDTRWTIHRVAADDGLVDTLDGGGTTEFTFLGDGRFAGATGCNRFFGQFITQPDGTIEAGPVGVTMMMCPDDVMEQERLVLAAIEATRSMTVADAELVCADATGSPVMALREH